MRFHYVDTWICTVVSLYLDSKACFALICLWELTFKCQTETILTLTTVGLMFNKVPLLPPYNP